jgi:exosortase B
MPKFPMPQQFLTPLPATLSPSPERGDVDASSPEAPMTLEAIPSATSSAVSSANASPPSAATPAAAFTAASSAARCSGLAAAARQWWPVWIGLALLFVPSIHDLLRGPWSTEEQGHGPIILGLALWLLWRKWPAVAAAASPSGAPAAGAVPLLLGLILYALGRSQHILMFEIGAIPVVLAALIWTVSGAAALRQVWFPVFFMLFMVPLPGELVAALTLPMKMAVSFVTETVLFAVGYPISRAGVILQIGQYQLLVADACAGLQTLLTLEALGLFYLNLKPHTSAVRNLVLALLIVPISFCANVIRVIVLTLITYHAGSSAGQGFLHSFAGIVLFLTALTLIMSADSALQWQLRRRAARPRTEHGAPA